jgi:hypothetical protein
MWRVVYVLVVVVVVCLLWGIEVLVHAGLLHCHSALVHGLALVCLSHHSDICEDGLLFFIDYVHLLQVLQLFNFALVQIL